MFICRPKGNDSATMSQARVEDEIAIEMDNLSPKAPEAKSDSDPDPESDNEPDTDLVLAINACKENEDDEGLARIAEHLREPGVVTGRVLSAAIAFSKKNKRLRVRQGCLENIRIYF